MAKEKVELLSELKQAAHNFKLVGTVKVDSKTFAGASKSEKSNWYGVNTRIGIETTKGNVVYPQIQGGYMLDNPTLSLVSNGEGNRVTIPWEHRNSEEMLKDVQNFVFYNIGIEKDQEGKVIQKRFVNAIDVEAYLAEHLKDGQNVTILGNVEYSEGKEDKVYRNFSIKNIYLNEGGKDREPAEPTAYLTQTYIVNEDTVEKGWEKEFAKNGEISVIMDVPQYLGKRRKSDGSYVTWKKVVPLPQTVVFRASQMRGDDIESKTKFVKKMIDIKSGVREIGLLVSINEGYTETEEATVADISDEMKELIDMGMITMEDISQQVRKRGTRTSELLFGSIRYDKTDDGIKLEIDDNKYSLEAIVRVDVDDEEVEEFKVESKKIEEPEIEEVDEFAAAQDVDFGSLFN